MSLTAPLGGSAAAGAAWAAQVAQLAAEFYDAWLAAVFPLPGGLCLDTERLRLLWHWQEPEREGSEAGEAAGAQDQADTAALVTGVVAGIAARSAGPRRRWRAAGSEPRGSRTRRRVRRAWWRCS
jgi:hypothetical protein